MGDASHSPKRRHILSSINPEDHGEPRRKRERRSPTRDDDPEAIASSGGHERSTEKTQDEMRDGDQHGTSDTTRPRRSRLKLKDDKSRHRSSRRHRHDEDDHDRRRSHRRERRHRRRSRSPTPTNPYQPDALDPDAAFRESLFDAMADDEGAAYWEGVYGQPVHIYTNEKPGPTGELERMTDEEYAAHVRQKMWEKTHAGLLEEQERRQREKQRRGEEERYNRQIQKDMEDSLRRGEERRKLRAMKARGDEYTVAWNNWNGTAETIDWPVLSGQRGDIDEKSVRLFYLQGLGLGTGAIDGPESLMSKLKDERVRWHPDKMQQRLGGQVDEAMMRDVTKVFQIIDAFWTETREEAADKASKTSGRKDAATRS